MQKKPPASPRNSRRLSRRHPRRFARRSGSTLERALFAQIFEAAADAHLLVDTGGSIILANQRAARMFAYARHLLIGMPCEKLFAPEFHPLLRERIAQLATPEPAAELPAAELPAAELPAEPAPTAQIELTALRKDGSSFAAEMALNPLPENQGLRALCVVRDISPRVERERKLKQQTELVQFLQDIAVAANEADSTHDALQYAVKRLARLLNWPLGHAYITDEDDTLKPTSIWSGEVPERFMVFKAVSEALSFRAGMGLLGWVLKNAQPIWLNDLPEQAQYIRHREARAAGLRTGLILPIIAGKRVVGVLEFYAEEAVRSDPNLLAILPHAGVQIGRVIERKQAEDRLRQQTAQLRLVMMNLPVIIWMVDRGGRLQLLEGKGLQDTQLDAQSLLGKDVFTEFTARPDLLALFKRALEGEEIHDEVSSATGAIFDSYFMPYYDKNWNVEGMVGLSFDVTRRKQLEHDLEEMKNRLIENADIERARLAQQLHDGPLQDLYGAFYSIQEAKTGWDAPQQATAEQTLRTIQNVNATLRMICGELHPSTLIHLGLQRAIRGHAERLQEHLEHTRIHLELEDDSPNTRSRLPADLRLSLFRIYQQLINNAARHANARDIWVRLWLPPNQAVLEVEDNGQGFQPPEQWIDLVRRSQYGLVSVLQRAQSQSGRFDLRARPGSGTLARVEIPRD